MGSYFLETILSSVINNSPSDQLLSCLTQLESHLTSNQKIVSCNEFSLADVVVWSTLLVIQSPESKLSSNIARDYPKIAQWYRSLARDSRFSSAVWAASNDKGFEGFYDFIIPSGSGKSKSTTTGGKGQSSKAEKERTQSASGLSPSSSTGDMIGQADIDKAMAHWNEGPDAAPKPRLHSHPILPIPGERNVLVTSALPYVNNVPHLGNIIGCVLSGDVFVRYARLRNYNTLYVCGTDEYGTATEVKAVKEGLTPQQICDKYYALHSEIYEWFNVDFDIFGRTSTPQQTQIAQDIFWHLYDRDLIKKDTVDQLLCTSCDKYLADRFVEGICPFCAYPDARGDQCDKCGKLINAVELKSPRCSICSSTPVVKQSNHLFLDLEKLQSPVFDWAQKSISEGVWSQNAQFITKSWLRDGLKPRCITRDLKWGTPVPLEGYTDKVFYVWFDAPIGYISITACYTDQWEKWWKNPEQVQLYQFMAKDNVPFHTVVFPSTLIGTGVDYSLLNHISSTEYLNYEDGKFSKSRGVGVFGNNAVETGIPADIYRFYLLYVRPESQDSAFSWSDFVMKNNSELLNNLGNFVNRTLSFIKSSFDSCIPVMTLSHDDSVIVVKVTQELQGYIECLERHKQRDGLKHILAISRLGNGHIQAHKPWELVKGDKNQKLLAGSLLGLCANICCLISVLLQPYMPSISKEIQNQLQAPSECNIIWDYFVPYLPTGHKIGQPLPLFKKIDDATANELKKQFSGQKQDTGASSAMGESSKSKLEAELAKQAEVVRSLKASGSATKETLDAEIAKLLELKKQLGISGASVGSKKKGKKTK
ncbi:PREDICTED: methionine--tRNA ligase, cytoplasmic-like isoform X2 [Amphimedon queenslandica]|uniref:Methionine--tRNA ligase, cytoplasmic n=1 Tax=Amphimedon queenslandica TaxID=400682 RepID=A0AAN0J2L7_AMPQE|nr:PREDICTED: methionine--tRNA ligase, cytoplasmic-like isoform X2 [Amphimedon queenslandica]|eukprot:XP_019851279.1 PREDICTED: methionine--tRNA ligase, cytoplasmic-like isoform X2 [Amphimedon queenslandica]